LASVDPHRIAHELDDEEPTMVEDRTSGSAEKSSAARDDELIDETGLESFPASDPPSTWSGEDALDSPIEGTDE
jgi:hypothetical protein